MAIARASRANRSAKAGSLADLRREDFERHQPVEPFLAGLVNHAHAATAYQFQDLQIGEIGRQLGRRGRSIAGCRLARRLAAASAWEASPHCNKQRGQSPCGVWAGRGTPH